jgi:hypothetical protein
VSSSLSFDVSRGVETRIDGSFFELSELDLEDVLGLSSVFDLLLEDVFDFSILLLLKYP